MFLAAITLIPLLALTEADKPMLLYITIGALMAMGHSLTGWLALVDRWKGKALDSTQFVTHAQLAEVKANRDVQLNETLGFIKDRLSALDSIVRDLSRDAPAIHRALGRVEGHDEACPATPPAPRDRRRR